MSRTVAYAAVIVLFGCAGPAPAPHTTSLVSGTPEPVPAAVASGAGGVIFVPVYSSVYVAEGAQTFDLTVTLSVRNPDRASPITVTGVRYYDTSGTLLHAYVEAPTGLGPLASAETVVRASDTRAGAGGSFLVEWSAEPGVAEPIVQAVMIGTGSQQGISFVTEGRVVERNARSVAAPPG